MDDTSSDLLPTSPAVMIDREACAAWIAEHGFEANDVAQATIRIDHHLRDGVGVWLDVTWYVRDATGALYSTPDRLSAASASTTVPLRSWPPLTPVPADA